MSQPLLSIGMIVKNEERCLEKCLKALEPLRQTIPCELVIADTGSTDKTPDIAKKHADKFINFKWVNDFAKARNFVLDHCSGKWHLYIDADEYLTDGISQLTAFLSSSAETKKNFASIIIRNHSTPQMNGPYTDFNSLRLFKTKPEHRFMGAIHEYVPYTTPDECCILTDVIFDHDGYTQITPKHLKDKEVRNLEILEKELSKMPTNIQTIIQCLEASTNNEKKRRYFTEYALDFLKNTVSDNSNWDILAPLCAFRIIVYLIRDNNSLAEEFFQWSFKNFGYSQYILVDAFFIYTKHLYQKQDFDSSIIYGKKYFENLKKYEESKHIVSQSAFINPVIFCNPYAQNEIRTIIGSSLLETNCTDDAVYYLENVELNLSDNETIKLWLKTVIECDNNTFHIKCKNSIYEILKNHKTNTNYNSAYNCINEAFFDYFSCLNNNVNCFFKDFELDIGLSYKISVAQTKEDAERYLSEIENPKELMPIALKQAIILRCDLPDNFLSLSFEHLTKVINDLSIVKNEIFNALIEKYLTTNCKHNFSYFSFFFNLSSALLFDQNSISCNTSTLILLPKYLTIADRYLSICYTATILENEDLVSCLPTNHLSAWYLIKANSLKESNPLEYIRTLRTALKKVPQAKQVIEFLIEEFKNEEELKRQERIKNTSPELIAMAEQLKTMLKAFPENSPELLAIKQSPMYKQVEFLIED